jgi:hypothetical protein
MGDLPAPTPARPATAEEIEQARDWSLQADADIKEAILRGRRALWEVAKQLHEWDLRQGWRWTGNYESLGEWLGDPQVAMTRTTYYRLRDGYRTLVIDRRVDETVVRELDTSKVGVVLRAVRDRDVRVEDAIADVESLSKSDLIEKYNPRAEEPLQNGTPTGGTLSQIATFDDDVMGEHELDVEDDPDEPVEADAQDLHDGHDHDDHEEEDEEDEEDEIECVLVARWLVEALVEKYDGTRRMKQEWLSELKAALADQHAHVD